MRWFLWFASILQRIQTSFELCQRRCRRPALETDGFDMILLNSGIWTVARSTAAGCAIPEAHIKARYNAEKHTILKTGSVDTKLDRWRWLSVIHKDKDLSDFFQGLRHSPGLELTNSEIMHLFTNQKGWYPTGDMEITLRNGFIDHICVFNGAYRILSNSEINKQCADINYIK